MSVLAFARRGGALRLAMLAALVASLFLLAAGVAYADDPPTAPQAVAR